MIIINNITGYTNFYISNSIENIMSVTLVSLTNEVNEITMFDINPNIFTYVPNSEENQRGYHIRTDNYEVLMGSLLYLFKTGLFMIIFEFNDNTIYKEIINYNVGAIEGYPRLDPNSVYY